MMNWLIRICKADVFLNGKQVLHAVDRTIQTQIHPHVDDVIDLFVEHADLLRTIRFPRSTLPIALLGRNLINAATRAKLHHPAKHELSAIGWCH